MLRKYQSFRSIKAAPVVLTVCPSADIHAADWIGGVTVKQFTNAPAPKVIQQQLTTLLEGAICVYV